MAHRGFRGCIQSTQRTDQDRTDRLIAHAERAHVLRAFFAQTRTRPSNSAMACLCQGCRPEWLERGWRCSARRLGRNVLPMPDDDDDELRAVLAESLRTAEAERLFREQLAMAVRCSTKIPGAAPAARTMPTARLTCLVCMEPASEGIECCRGRGEPRSGHFLCSGCLPQYVRSELEADEASGRRLMERRAFRHCVRCPNRANCQGWLQLDDIRPLVPSDLWSQLQVTAEADENHQRWQREYRQADQDPERLREALLRSMPNAVQCGRCSYGPIDHVACSDLDAHHGERHGNARISNQCPQCGWWQHNIRQWPRWDGVVRLGDAKWGS